MSTLQTLYLGLTLRSPIVVSAGPATRDPESAVRLEEAGAAAIVLPSLFEEEIVNEELGLYQALEAGAGTFTETQSYFPTIEAFDTTADRYLAALEQAAVRIGRSDFPKDLRSVEEDHRHCRPPPRNARVGFRRWNRHEWCDLASSSS